jgi:hypothetical protein
MGTFKDRLLEALKRLFSSSKVITAIAGLLVYLAAKRGIILSPEDAQGILAVVAVLVGAQGITDLGKGKAQEEAKAPKMPEQINVQNLTLPKEKEK